MITKPQDWENVQEFSERKALPLGAYICRIKKASVEETDYGNVLALAFDIEDGEYAGYYADEFKNNPSNTKKWKGFLRQFLPRNDGSDKDEWTKSSLKGLITSVERSNLGYTWNWDERTLAGKLIGVIMRKEEWEYEGKHGWAVRPYRACSVESVQDGSYYIPKDKPLKKSDTSASTYVPTDYQSSFIETTDGDLPF